MAATTKLGMTLPAGPDGFSRTIWNGSLVKIDDAVGVVICTSTTRPATPWTGQPIFETDTSNFLVWNGTAWKATNGSVHICTSITKPGSTLTFGGFAIFETDTGRFLIRNAANSAWIFPTVSSVAALADITSPISDQVAFDRATRAWALYHSGAPMWVPISPGGLVRGIYPTQTTALTAAASAETDVPKLAFTSVSLVSGHRYRFTYDLICSTSAAGDVFDFILRKGAAITGTQIQIRRHIAVTNGNYGAGWKVSFNYTAAATEIATANFRLSFARVGGSGTLQVYQDTTMFNFAEMVDMGIVGAGIVTDVA